MDDIEQLKRDLKHAITLAEDTNRIVHKMRRAALWGSFLQIAWWVAVFAISGAAYYYYLQPYVERIQHLYTQLEGGSAPQQPPSLTQDIQNFWSGLHK